MESEEHTEMTTHFAASIAAAIQNRCSLRILYAPGYRYIEPHAYGTGSDSQMLLRAYQTSGASDSGEHENWKLFRVDRIEIVEPSGDPSEAPRPGYKRGDRAMKGGIIAQV